MKGEFTGVDYAAWVKFTSSSRFFGSLHRVLCLLPGEDFRVFLVICRVFNHTTQPLFISSVGWQPQFLPSSKPVGNYSTDQKKESKSRSLNNSSSEILHMG